MMKKNRLLLMIILIMVGFLGFVREVYAGTVNPVFDMTGWWWLDDDPSVADAEDNTGFGAGNVVENTNITGLVKSSNVRLRIDNEETAGQSTKTNLAPMLEYQAGDLACDAGGTWVTITTSTSNAFALMDTANITDGTNTAVDRISTDTQTFSASGELLDQTNPATGDDLRAKAFENEWNIQATTNAGDSTIYSFRVTNNGTLLNAYNLPVTNDCPTVTTAAAASPSFTQFEYKWWTNTAAIVPAGPWGTPDLAKNTPIPFSNEALENTNIIRLRISLSNASADCAVGCDNWKLRFATLAPGEACSGGTYGDVAADGGSCSGAWCVDDNTNYADGATLSDCSVGGNNCITTTNITGEAEDVDNAFNNPVAITLTEDGEWDVNLIANSLADATQYCFKVVDSTGTDLGGGYTNYAQLISIPGMSGMMRHGNFFDSAGSEQGYYWVD